MGWTFRCRVHLNMSNWADLPQFILDEIIFRLSFFDDIFVVVLSASRGDQLLIHWKNHHYLLNVLGLCLLKKKMKAIKKVRHVAFSTYHILKSTISTSLSLFEENA